MTETLTSDIFFFIASVGFIILAIGWLVLIYFVIRVVKEVSAIVEEAKNTFIVVRDQLKEQPFVGKFFKEKPVRKRAKRKKKENPVA